MYATDPYLCTSGRPLVPSNAWDLSFLFYVCVGKSTWTWLYLFSVYTLSTDKDEDTNHTPDLSPVHVAAHLVLQKLTLHVHEQSVLAPFSFRPFPSGPALNRRIAVGIDVPSLEVALAVAGEEVVVVAVRGHGHHCLTQLLCG